MFICQPNKQLESSANLFHRIGTNSEEINLLSLLIIGFILGIKHEFEPDHIIGVSTTIVSQSKQLWKSSLVGIFGGIKNVRKVLKHIYERSFCRLLAMFEAIVKVYFCEL